MRTIRIISRIFIGAVFIFSGFVKAIDPLGFTYKFIDYFNAFGIGFLEPVAFPLSILMSGIELVIGFSMLVGYRMKLASLVLLIFMSFFTVLTLILALTNPVHDCGCFGDAVILTNWQTFWKNILLMVFTLIIWFERSNFGVVQTAKREYSILGIFFLSIIVLSVYCYRNLPVIDFRPYKVGTYIKDAMVIPKDAPQSEYKTTVTYKNTQTGKTKKFALENIPEDKEIWEWVDSESKLVKPGYEPPIHDFNIYSDDGAEITDIILDQENYSFLLIAYNLEEADLDALIEANQFYRLSLVLPDLNFYAITSSLPEVMDSLRNYHGVEYNFFQADEITLKTIIRANPGLVLLHDGTIVGKWHFRNFPMKKEEAKLAHVFDTYPFCPGCDLRSMSNKHQPGYKENYEAILYYRNILNDSLAAFTINNYPIDDNNWVFEDSQSVLISGDVNALSGFSPVSENGEDLRQLILDNPGYSLAFLIKNLEGIKEDVLDKIIKLGGMAGDYLDDELQVFAFVPDKDEDLININDQYLTTFRFSHLSGKFLNSLKSDLSVLLIYDGKIIFNIDDSNIPDPEALAESAIMPELINAGNSIMPAVLSSQRKINRNLIISISVFSLLLFISILGYFNTRRSSDNAKETT